MIGSYPGAAHKSGADHDTDEAAEQGVEGIYHTDLPGYGPQTRSLPNGQGDLEHYGPIAGPLIEVSRPLKRLMDLIAAWAFFEILFLLPISLQESIDGFKG